MNLFDFMFHSIYDQSSLVVMALGLIGHGVADFIRGPSDDRSGSRD
jgi:hypothetical protein